jgi:hypothetical protein
MERIVQPELLDDLPADDPRALRSRRDLGRVNWWMGNAAHLAAMLRRLPAVPKRIVELGAGDGCFALQLAQALRPWREVELVLVDRQNAFNQKTQSRIQAAGWRAHLEQADVFDWLNAGERADCIVANLFLHHFEEDPLREMFRLIAAKTPFFAACETRRSRQSLFGSRLVGLIGCGPVTRHDAVISVRAGFRQGELSGLWPAAARWKTEEFEAGLATHCFMAMAPS